MQYQEFWASQHQYPCAFQNGHTVKDGAHLARENKNVAVLRQNSLQKQSETKSDKQLVFIKIHKHFECTPKGIV